MTKRPGFMFYLDWEESMMSLPAPELQEMLQAMIDYTKTGRTPEFSSRVASALWSLYRARMDRDAQRYEKTVQSRQSCANKRWEKQRQADGAPRSAPTSAPAAASNAAQMNKYLNW